MALSCSSETTSQEDGAPETDGRSAVSDAGPVADRGQPLEEAGRSDGTNPGPDSDSNAGDSGAGDHGAQDGAAGDLAAPDGPPPPGTFSQTQPTGSNPGNLKMYTFVPGAVPQSPAPLVVALHGCNLDAFQHAQASGWNTLADRRGFYVLYPQQTSANNLLSCFNWFKPGDVSRGQGELLSIVQMVDQMIQTHAIDPQRVFASGLSSGAALAVALGVAYPDRFAGVAAAAGIPYGCADSNISATGCMLGKNETPETWGDLALAAFTGFSGSYPPLALFQGTADGTVSFSNFNELTEQWIALHQASVTPQVSDTIGIHPHRVYKGAQGQTVLESFELTGMGHGIPVDPGSGATEGGSTSWFSFDVDLWAPYYSARLWGLL